MSKKHPVIYFIEARFPGRAVKEAVFEADTPPTDEEIRQCLRVDETWSVSYSQGIRLTEAKDDPRPMFPSALSSV